MKAFLLGISYNLRGLKLGLRTKRLLALGAARFLVLVVITIAAVAIILAKYQEILNLMWVRPESVWILWLWYLTSWIIGLLLLGVSALLGYVLSQLLFSVFIMDRMSQITERLASGGLRKPVHLPWYKYFVHLVRQELPRAILPILISLLLLVLGWFTPLGPLLTVVAPLAASLFLAWDNTDLVPARRMAPLSQRFSFLRKNLGFHLGFGILFLIPVLNIVLLAFAPVGATLFHVERRDPQAR